MQINNSTTVYDANRVPDSDFFTSTVTWFIAFSCVSTVIFNGLMVLFYSTNASLRVPFNTVVINLCVAEVLLGIFAMSGNFFGSYYGYWPFNADYCSVVSGGNQILSSAVRYGHVLISMNRLWAVTFPMSYRERHTLVFTTGSAALMWIFVLSLHLGVVIPGRIHPINGDNHCLVNTRFQYRSAVTTEVLGFVLPEMMVIAIYPIIVYKLRQRNSNLSKRKVHPEMTHHSK